MAQKHTYDREMIGALRTKVAQDILEVLNETPKGKKFKGLKKEMLLRLAPTVMPRVTELTGADGEPLQVIIPQQVASAFGINATESNRQANSSDSK